MMLDSVIKFLKTPSFADEEQNRKANLLQFTLLTMFFGSIAGIILFLALGESYMNLVFCYMLAGTIVSFLVLRFSRLRFASWTLLLWLLISLILVLASGLPNRKRLQVLSLMLSALMRLLPR